jgi:hypothetical protein
VLDAERDAVGLDRRHEAGAGAMVPSGVRSGRTVGCIVDLQDCGIAFIDRANASNSSLVRHDRPSAAARREDVHGAAIPMSDGRARGSWRQEAAHRNTSGVMLTGHDHVPSPEGGWGIAGHANTNADIAAAARAALAGR